MAARKVKGASVEFGFVELEGRGWQGGEDIRIIGGDAGGIGERHDDSNCNGYR
jgi:hypothetical protein